MTILIDPEGNETAALHDLVSIGGMQVLEIGCGDGRLTWRYADQAAHVIAIDPDGDEISKALEALPDRLQDRVEFAVSSFEDYGPPDDAPKFDLVLFAWSL